MHTQEKPVTYWEHNSEGKPIHQVRIRQRSNGTTETHYRRTEPGLWWNTRPGRWTLMTVKRTA